MTFDTLRPLGWTDHEHEHWNAHDRTGTAPARIVIAYGPRAVARDDTGEHEVVLSGRLREETTLLVGDWVALETPEKARVAEVLPRRTLLERRAAGGDGRAQGIAANVDLVLVVLPLDRPPNARWVERAVTLAWGSGATPVLVLTKTDLVDGSQVLALAQEAAPGVEAFAVSAVTGDGLEALSGVLAPGRTCVMLGASGAGKSTLANRWIGADHFATGAVRDDDARGRHTTTHRELVQLASGALLVDAPGVRELGLVADEEALEATFSDVAAIADNCRFGDCTHQHEPGCAVLQAVASGTLEADRVESWLALAAEQRRFEERSDPLARRERTSRIKAQRRSLRLHPKYQR